jgi:hypothetical protein
MQHRFEAPKIMLIRHAEKPNGIDDGVSPTGKQGSQHLSPRGWQRAGALAVLFAHPSSTMVHQPLAKPDYLFAVKDGSRRSMQTIKPLSDKLGLPIRPGMKGREAELAEEAAALNGVVLIAWQRERIPLIAARLLAGSPDERQCPKFWPPDCFDMVWVFDLHPATGTYAFTQVPQQLLSGDRELGIAAAPPSKLRSFATHGVRVFQRMLHPEIARPYRQS